MTSPFKSTLSVAARRRQRPVVERSTFVIASIGDARIAIPVEQVERVIRVAASHAAGAVEHVVAHAGQALPVQRLALLLGTAAGDTTADTTANTASDARAETHAELTAHSRVLIVRGDAARASLRALQVDRVHEVFAIETALVQSPDAEHVAPFAHAAVRGQFPQAGCTAWVVEVSRLSRAS